METTLAKKMIEAADKEQFSESHILRSLAKKFDEASVGFYATPQTVSVAEFMSAWARARKAWSIHSGEPLV